MPGPLFIIWKPEFETGISILDEQNRALTSLINTFFLHRSDVHKDIHRILVPTMEVFKAYAKLNFLTIEKLMILANYDDVKKYQKVHSEVLTNITSREARYRAAKDGDGMLQYLKSYWIDSIKNSKNYIDHLKSYFCKSK